MAALTADCIYKYVGIAVVVLFLLYLASQAFTMQVSFFTRLFSTGGGGHSMSGNSSMSGSIGNDLQEGFADATTVSATIKNFTSKMDDPLLVVKYRKTYEQVIVDLDDNMKTFVLASVLKNAENLSADPGSEENQRIVTSITNASAFRKTLNEAMGILNAHK